MMRAGVVLGVLLTAVLGFAAVSGASARTQAVDRVCSNIRAEYKFFGAYPPGPRWVWSIPSGCVFLRDRPQKADCQGRADDGCTPPPDVHIRYRRRTYVFHLTLKGLPAKAKGIWTAGGTRIFIVAHDGRPPKARERLFIEFTAREFDGLLQSGPSQGLPDLGPGLRWEIAYNINKKNGLCCPRVDPSTPNVSRFDVAPQRFSTVSG
jgi:hypothetical protein